MQPETIIQLLVALVAIVPGVVALIRQRQRDRQDAAGAARDDNREDFAALFEAAKQLGDAGTALVEPLTKTVGDLRAEMKKRDAQHREELQDIEIRLTAAEFEIAQLRDINTKLADVNERYEALFRWLVSELNRLAKVNPETFPKDGNPPRFAKEH